MEKRKTNKSSDGETSKPIWKKWWFWAIVVIALISGTNTINYNKDQQNKENTETNIAEATKLVEETKLAEETTPQTEKEEETSTSTNRLITMENHPVLYDYLSAAHIFWDNDAEGSIDFPDDYFDDYKEGKTVLIIDAYVNAERDKTDHLIQGFEIYPDTKITLDEGLEIAKTYLPLDILKEWYTKEHSYCYSYEDSNEYIYYALYVPTENGKKSIDESGIDYNYARVMVYVENDVVTAILISSTNSMPNMGNEYELQEWSYDFLTKN